MVLELGSPVGRAAGGRSPGLTPRLMTRTPAPAAASCSASVRCLAARRFADLVPPGYHVQSIRQACSSLSRPTSWQLQLRNCSPENMRHHGSHPSTEDC